MKLYYSQETCKIRRKSQWTILCVQGMYSQIWYTTYFISIRIESTFLFTLINTYKAINASTKLHFYLTFFHCSFVTMRKKKQRWWRIFSNFQWLHHKSIRVCQNLWDSLMVMMQKHVCGSVYTNEYTNPMMFFFFFFWLLEQRKVFQPIKELSGSHPNHTKI